MQNMKHVERAARATSTPPSSPLLFVLLSLVVVLSSPSTARAQTEHLSTLCPGGLVCRHGGSCATGDKDHSFLVGRTGFNDLPWLDATNVNGEHCTDCHAGWGGVDCTVRYTPCDPDEPEGTITCFNGGECIVTAYDTLTGKREHMCDCTDAGSEEGDGSVRYAGKFCQHVREVECGSGTEEMFCTNGGTCAIFDEDANRARYGCECPEHRGGTHCEFLAGDELVDCQLHCDRGTCAKGFKSYDDLVNSGAYPAQLAFDVITSGGEHCVCPEGYTGLRCEIRVAECGPSKFCYNGATCTYDDDGDPVCDCNAAHTDYVSYAGSSCEQEATTRCVPGLDQDEKDAFCANHGRCIEDPETRHNGCVCEDGWSGDLCDIEVIEGSDVPVPVCDLPCENDGSCRFGVKGYKDTYDSLNLPIHAQKHEDGMYCSCPDGFTGLQCEVDINHCRDDGSGSENRFCLNGVPCAPDDDASSGNSVVKTFGCQCDASAAVLPLAGRFCEFAVTEFCSRNGMRHSHSFCTNGGKCKVMNEHDDSEHHGCCCPDGYEGEHCQFPAGTVDKTRAVNWSPFSECQHEKTSQGMFMHPNANGEWDHITINPAFRVPSHNATSLGATAVVDDYKGKSGAGGIVSGILVALLVVGLAGVAYRKRSTKEDPHQFETDWWRGNVFDSEWWKGETGGAIHSDTNIAPYRSSPPPPKRKSTNFDNLMPNTLSRQWSYPPVNSMSEDSLDGERGHSYPVGQSKSTDGLEWERGDYNDNSDLHDIII